MADTLLLVEHDADVRRVVGDYFARIGYDVARAATGEQGVEAFERGRPDVVVVDLHLPDASGLAVLERGRAMGVAVILLAGPGDGETAVRAMQLGAETFLTKPVDVSHLAAAVARVADRRHVPQALAEVEREHIERTLRAHGGNRTRAAQELGISRATLINKIKVYRLDL